MSSPARGSPSPRRSLSFRLSSSCPRLLTHLAHEPSEGLYVIANHARGTAVPTLVAARRTLNSRADGLAESALDARYAVQALEQHRKTAMPALEAVAAALADASNELSAK